VYFGHREFRGHAEGDLIAFASAFMYTVYLFSPSNSRPTRAPMIGACRGGASDAVRPGNRLQDVQECDVHH